MGGNSNICPEIFNMLCVDRLNRIITGDVADNSLAELDSCEFDCLTCRCIES